MRSTRTSSIRRILRIGLMLAVPACQAAGPPRDGDATGPSLEIGPSTPLAASLLLMRSQLDSAAESGLDDDGTRNLDRAEAISDRLLETRLPFQWISAESYSLEARLRQIQSRADRVESLRAVGARREDVLAEIRQLMAGVDSLLADLAKGGSPAPPPVEQLLIRLDTARR